MFSFLLGFCIYGKTQQRFEPHRNINKTSAHVALIAQIHLA